MKGLLKHIFAVVVLTLAAGCMFLLSGCSSGTYKVSGKVTGPDGKPVPGITLEYKGSANGKVETDSKGRWSIKDLKGKVEITPVKEGWGFTPEVYTGDKGAKNIVFDGTDTPMPKVKNVKLQKDSVGKYELLEIQVDLKATFTNPFNTDEIALDGVFTTPSGKEIVHPGFVSRDFEPFDTIIWVGTNKNGGIKLDGTEKWLIRFSAAETGEYKFKVRLKDKNGSVEKEGAAFAVTDSQIPGPVQFSDTNPYYMQYKDSKKDFFPVGFNLPWSWPQTMSDYERLVPPFAENGGNYTRIWASGLDQTLSLETKEMGFRWYQMDHAAITDNQFKLMRDHGVSIGYCIESFTSLQKDLNWYGEWHNNPYNKVNGGPLDSPAKYWTDEEARKAFKDKLRYTIARWGWDTNVVRWELWNEIDGTTGYNQVTVAKWCKEMGQYLKEIDMYKRPISTSFAHVYGYDTQVHKIPELDVATLHYYGSPDMAEETYNNITDYLRKYEKPVLVGEYGINADDFAKDPDGIGFHNGLWAGVMAGSYATPQSWWWDEHIYPNEIFKQLKPMRDFVSQFSFSSEKLQDIKGDMRVPTEIRALGQKAVSANRGIFWIQNKNHTWSKVYNNGMKEPAAITNIPVQVVNLKDGEYTLKMWDTWEGKLLKESKVTVKNGTMEFTIDSLTRDIAFLFEQTGN